MKLADYLTRQKLSPTKFAEEIGVPVSTVTRLLRGERQPRLETIQKITDATNGAVKAKDFMPTRAAA